MAVFSEKVVEDAYKYILSNNEYVSCVSKIMLVEGLIIKSLSGNKSLLECENLIRTATNIYIENLYEIVLKKCFDSPSSGRSRRFK